MSHPEQLGFFAEVERANLAVVEFSKVVEIGSFDVNGSVRTIFRRSVEYVGVDLLEGPGVDLIAFGHEVDYPDGHFDLAISGECFEHDPHWVETFQNMCRMTRAGGLVAVTCASRGRPEHGTRRTDLEESPGTQFRGLDYYRNLEAADFHAVINLSEVFNDYRFWYLPTSLDLYFAGVRKGELASTSTAHIPDKAAVEALRGLMSLPHRIVRLPLRLMVRVLSPDLYQSWAVPYWRTLLNAQDRLTGGAFRRAGRGSTQH